MAAVPPGWRKWTRRRLPLVAAGVVVAGLLALLLLHMVMDLALAVFDQPSPPPAPAMASVAPPAKAAAPAAPRADGPFVVRSILSIPGPIKFGQFYWDETRGEPGPVVITVDLTARVLSVFENGHEVGAAAILKGYGDKPTPLGVFPITQKDARHVSSIYDAPMPWMLRLTNDGVSIHGSKVQAGYATNGCIGVPDAFAAKLFGVAHLGDRVIITDGKQLKLGDPIVTPAKG
ncbi:L,D-transpeptidase family protein [Novosphingobium acidiphilum]|uniref:L,D-transpeptidase family protein n=1 Tax=Novosphingobium acidiphilum TaxID=505248 RepID=UPI0004273BFC|nr:L,D-transpeptidase family protein [Novosphingobium acidiphilum]